MREKVAEVVEWILSGIAPSDTSLAEIRRDGNAQAEGLVPGQDSTRQQVAQVERHRTWRGRSRMMKLKLERRRRGDACGSA